MCGFPTAMHDHQFVLTTRTNGRDITWDVALARRYTLMPKPYTDYAPQLLRAQSWTTIAVRAWRARQQHPGLFTAFRAEHSEAREDTRRKNERAAADLQASRNAHRAEWESAQRTFRDRH